MARAAGEVPGDAVKLRKPRRSTSGKRDDHDRADPSVTRVLFCSSSVSHSSPGAKSASQESTGIRARYDEARREGWRAHVVATREADWLIPMFGSWCRSE